jgi:outer membrane protein OmpA-like peptidoglycan-associated protein
VCFLVSRGVSPDRMTAIGFADTKPEVANRDEFGMLTKKNQELTDAS